MGESLQWQHLSDFQRHPMVVKKLRESQLQREKYELKSARNLTQKMLHRMEKYMDDIWALPPVRVRQNLCSISITTKFTEVGWKITLVLSPSWDSTHSISLQSPIKTSSWVFSGEVNLTSWRYSDHNHKQLKNTQATYTVWFQPNVFHKRLVKSNTKESVYKHHWSLDSKAVMPK